MKKISSNFWKISLIRFLKEKTRISMSGSLHFAYCDAWFRTLVIDIHFVIRWKFNVESDGRINFFQIQIISSINHFLLAYKLRNIMFCTLILTPCMLTINPKPTRVKLTKLTKLTSTYLIDELLLYYILKVGTIISKSKPIVFLHEDGCSYKRVRNCGYNCKTKSNILVF